MLNLKTKTNLAGMFAAVAWFAVITQYVLMIKNSSLSILEITVRFFSYFTILTNVLVARYLTFLIVPEEKRPRIMNTVGTLTAITVYIAIVGCVYQILLRHVWSPQGIQRLVDELLHSVVPILVVIFWYLYESKAKITYAQIFKWAIYPLAYLIYVLIRGYFSDFYPYYFIDVGKLGIQKTLITSGILLGVFFAFSALFIFFGKISARKEPTV